jgi:hypothetical protein
MDAVGLIGVLVFLAGLHLTWLARDAVFYWVEFAVTTWRTALRALLNNRPADDPAVSAVARGSGRAHVPATHTLCLVGGLGLIFLGQLLVVLALLF